MKVSIVVPAYNEENYIGLCLDSLVNQEEHADEIIVVDNNCSDRTVEIARQYKHVRVVKETIQGMTPARNKGFNSVQHEIIARTDADTSVPKNWVKKIKKEFANDPSLVGLSGRAYFNELPPFLKHPYWPPTALVRAATKIFKHDVMFGPNMALRKSAWEKIKNEICLDDHTVHEDIDLAIHLATVGTIKFDRTFRVISSPRRFKKLKLYIDWPYRYFKMLGKHNRFLTQLNDKVSLRQLRTVSWREFLRKVID
jgi:glycosyltransferase involved in cell wall biosynthesis